MNHPPNDYEYQRYQDLLATISSNADIIIKNGKSHWAEGKQI